MSKLKIIGNDSGIGTFTIISPNSDTDATTELPHSSGTLVTNSQDLIPTQDEIYDLGSSTKKFKDVYLSGSTLNLGNQSISASATGIIVPELQIGTGLGAVKLKASSDGKLKQTSNTADGIETPEIKIPEKLIDLLDIRDTAPAQNDKTLVWSDATSKFEFLTVPEVFSDFTDVDITTIPPTDTQVLTWSDANNEWGAGNNGFPLTVANITELLALTGMLVGQEAFVTDLNRSYTYTGSTPNDNWRHAVSGWYATDDIMTNHPITEITGIDSTYSLLSIGSSITITADANDPDQKPISWEIDTIENGADVNFNQTDNVLVVSQLPSEGSPTTPIDMIATFKAYDDSLDPTFFTTTISAFRIFSRVGWEDGTMIFDWGYSVGPDYLGHGKSIDISSDGSTLIVSDSVWNKALIYDKTINDTWVKNPAESFRDETGYGPYFRTFASELYPYQPKGFTEEFPNGQRDDLGYSNHSGGNDYLPYGIYSASIQTRFGYAGRTVALSADGLTAAVACTGETIGADIWEPDGSEELPYVDIFNRDPITRIWTRVAHKLSPSAYNPTAMPWTGHFTFATDINKPSTVWHSGSRGAGSGGVIVPSAGMTIALSKGGTTLVVGYRLEGPKLTPHNQYADRSSTDDMVNPYGPGYAIHHEGENGLLGDTNWYNYGAVYIYEKDSNNNWSLDEKLYGNSEAGSFGAAVDIAGEIDDGVDTRRIIVSTPNYNGGYVNVLEKTGNSGTVWRYVTNIVPPDYDNNAVNKTNNRFGFNSISISKDGTKIAVGDPGQSVTNVIESSAPYGAGDLTRHSSTEDNQGGIVSSTNNFNVNHTYPVGVVYTYEKTGTANQWFQADYASDTWALQTNGIVENFIGVDGDGFGDRVDLNFDGSILSVGAPYEHNGFYFPGAYVGVKYINEYSAKRVFYGWHRFSHGGGSPNIRPDTSQPANTSELDAWNYTEATEAINCTVNSTSYVGFVTPADGKVDAFDLSVSFTSIAGDDDVIAIVLAFNVDSNGREHTISLIRSGNNGYPSQYVYAIVYNFAMPDESTIFDGNSLIPTHHSSWANPSTGTQTFIRNRIVRSGDSFTVTTSQAIDISNHTGNNSQLDNSTTHTFSLGSYSFGNLFSAANGGARWGFSCMSQDDSSWVNVELVDAINPEEIPDTGAVHIYQRNVLDSWDKTNRFYPSITTHNCIPDSSGFLGMDCSISNPVQKLTDCHFGRLALSDDAKVLVSGYKKNASGKSHYTNEDLGRFEIFAAPFKNSLPTPITGVSSNAVLDFSGGSVTLSAASIDPAGGTIVWTYTTTGTLGNTTISNSNNGSFIITSSLHDIEHEFTLTIIATSATGSAIKNITCTYELPVVSPNSTVFYESEPGGENDPAHLYNDSGTNHTWTCPTNVYYVHALCIGGGGHIYQTNQIGKGGGGGGLGWKNNIPVVPGQSYNVRVGRGGHSNYNSNGMGGYGTSWFINSVTVQGQGGGALTGGGYIGDGGGKGGDGSFLTYSAGGTTPNGTSGAGGGAGGYGGPPANNAGQQFGPGADAGYGGDASASSGLPADYNAFGASNGSAGSGGGGGGGAMNSSQFGYAGGGVGINGQGTSGAGGVLGSSGSGSAGKGGSGGQDADQTFNVSATLVGRSGGDFGGGGSGAALPANGDHGGGDGVVKLIWGTGSNAPLWPSTNIPQTNPQFQTNAQKGIY